MSAPIPMPSNSPPRLMSSATTWRESPAMTHGVPLVRLCPEGCPVRPSRKTNPEGRQVARILRHPDQGTQPCAKSDQRSTRNEKSAPF
jgi:hypothetical protein